MDAWPEITEPLLRERQAMTDDEFFEFVAGLLDAVGTRTIEDGHFEQAIGYPWDRRPGSCLVTDGQVEDADEHAIAEFMASPGRIPLLAYGANASPERLALKFAHLPEGHRRALVLAGDLDGFDVAATAQPPLFSSMPGTLVPSPGTKLRAGVLLCDSVQFTTLWWTELSYRVGALHVPFVPDVGPAPIERTLAFISRYGAFTIGGDPALLVAVDARDRRWPAYTQEQVMDAAARLTLGDGAVARDLVKAAYERPAEFYAEHLQAFRSVAVPFESERWALMPA